MDIQWLFIILCLGALAFWGTVKLRRHILAMRLRNPEIRGICLPTVDDPRWREPNDRWGSDDVMELGEFSVYRSGVIRFEMNVVGLWPEYAKAVFDPFDAARQKQRIERALRELEEAK